MTTEPVTPTRRGHRPNERKADRSDSNKDPVAVQIGLRIKQVREMAGFPTQAALSERLREHGWSPSRLSNYEAGISTPGPEETSLIANLTTSSECWIMFGLGPIRSLARDKQAVRHQNLVFRIRVLQRESGRYEAFLRKAKLKPAKLQAHMEDPGLAISDRFARGFEKLLGERKGWMDEQHVDHDPLFNNFPDALRELIHVYSELDDRYRDILLEMSRTLKAMRDRE